MARKRRQREPTLVNFAQEDVRAAFQRAMHADAELLGVISNHVYMFVQGDQVHAFDERERSHLNKAHAEIRQALRRLEAVSRRKRG